MKLGMVFEGGASRTIFSCGVADAFLEENIMPDYFIGVSAGIAFGLSYLSKQHGRNLELARKYMSDGNYQGFKFLFDKNRKTFYNLDYVFDEVPRDSSSMSVIEASCALPVFFKPVQVGRRYYLDGGVADSVPFERALEQGCDKVIVVLTRERGYEKHTDGGTKISSALYRRYPNIVKDLKERPAKYNESMQKLFRLEKEGRVFVIAPDTTHGVGRTESDPKRLEELYEEGYLEGKEQMVALKNYLKK